MADAMTSDFTASLPRKRMGAGVLLSDAEGRVLLVEPTCKPDWEIPGGRLSPRLLGWAVGPQWLRDFRAVTRGAGAAG